MVVGIFFLFPSFPQAKVTGSCFFFFCHQSDSANEIRIERAQAGRRVRKVRRTLQSLCAKGKRQEVAAVVSTAALSIGAGRCRCRYGRWMSEPASE